VHPGERPTATGGTVRTLVVLSTIALMVIVLVVLLLSGHL
jgi:hypothetical protein